MDLFVQQPLPVTHLIENNPASQQHLDERRQDFNEGCKRVYDALINGERLTVAGAMGTLSGDLRRRIKDLKDAGIQISDEWQHDGNGRKIGKVWYMTAEQVKSNKVKGEQK